MKYISLCSFILVLLQLLGTSSAQRVAPGVPPQHYQQPQQHQQQHQQPQYQQNQHQQQQQQPQYQQQQQQQQQQPQQHQQHQQQQQAPVPQYQQQQGHQQQQQQPQQGHQQQGHQQQHGSHGQHASHGQPNQVLNAANIQHEKEHIAEHLEVPMDTSKMSEQELQFHYFKMHDADNNNKLDGCELIKSLIHWHVQGSREQHHTTGQPHIEDKVFSDEELTALIDPILQMDDTSRDGFIDYPEFVKAQQKAVENQKKNPNNNRK